MPPTDPNVHIIQFYDDGHATVEKKVGEREWLDGEAAQALIQPYLEAWQAADADEQSGGKPADAVSF